MVWCRPLRLSWARLHLHRLLPCPRRHLVQDPASLTETRETCGATSCQLPRRRPVPCIVVIIVGAHFKNIALLNQTDDAHVRNLLL